MLATVKVVSESLSDPLRVVEAEEAATFTKSSTPKPVSSVTRINVD